MDWIWFSYGLLIGVILGASIGALVMAALATKETQELSTFSGSMPTLGTRIIPPGQRQARP